MNSYTSKFKAFNNINIKFMKQLLQIKVCKTKILK